MLLCCSNKIELGWEEKINRDQIRRWRSDNLRSFITIIKALIYTTRIIYTLNIPCYDNHVIKKSGTH